jgi:hypothetical protein
MIVDIIEYAKLRLLGPSFDGTGDEMRSQDKINTWWEKKDKKEGTKFVFSIKLNVNHISCSVKCGVLLLLFLGPGLAQGLANIVLMINHYGAFTLDVKLVLNKNLGGILSGTQC